MTNADRATPRGMAILAMSLHGQDARATPLCGMAILAMSGHGQDARATRTVPVLAPDLFILYFQRLWRFAGGPSPRYCRIISSNRYAASPQHSTVTPGSRKDPFLSLPCRRYCPCKLGCPTGRSRLATRKGW